MNIGMETELADEGREISPRQLRNQADISKLENGTRNPSCRLNWNIRLVGQSWQSRDIWNS